MSFSRITTRISSLGTVRSMLSAFTLSTFIAAQALFAFPNTALAQVGVEWTALTPGAETGIKFGTTNSASSVTYGDGKFVAVGVQGKASYSTNGIDWTDLTPGADTGIKFDTTSASSVAYGDGKFVVVGIGGKASYSTNGTEWTSIDVEFGATNVFSVTYGDGKFVAVGESGKASYSEDGINWTALPDGDDEEGIKFGFGRANSIIYGDGKFVVVGGGGRASYSTNGIDWTALPAGEGTGIKFGGDDAYSVTYGDGKFVVVGTNGRASYSTNGIDWTALTPGEGTGIKFGATTARSVTYGDGKFVVVGIGGKASYSTNGTEWTSIDVEFGATDVFSVTYGDGKFVAVGAQGKASYSADTTPPTIQTLSPANNATDVAADTSLVITFDEAVNAASGNITIKKTGDNSTIESINVTGGQVTGGGTDTITINLANALASATQYYVRIADTAFEDLSGNAFAGISDTSTWTFTTAGFAQSEPTPTPAILTRINALFRLAFNRNPTVSEWRYWVYRVEDKPTEDALLGAMQWQRQTRSTSPISGERLTSLNQGFLPLTNQLFRTTYGRTPTVLEWRYWAHRTAYQGEFESIDQLLGAMQYQHREGRSPQYITSLNQGIIPSINTLHRLVFDSNPTVAGWTFWADRVVSGGKITIPELLGAMQWQRMFGR